MILKIKPDIVHTHTFKAGVLGRTAAFVARTPIVVHTYHGHLLNNYWSGWKLFILKHIEKIFCSMTDACIGVSQQVSQDLVNALVIPSEKMKTIPLGFDFTYLKNEMQAPSNIRTQLNISKNDFVFGTACRLVPIKNIELLIKSAVPILNRFQNSHLVIIGQGPEKESLVELAHQLTEFNTSLLKRIYFLNWIVPFQRELKDFDLYICSSKNEGTSVSVIEALIAKIPVISTAVGGMPDLLQLGRLGQLVKTENTQELSAAIESHYIEFIKGAEAYRTQAQLAEYSKVISDIYNESNLIKYTDQVYKEIIKNKIIQRTGHQR